MLTRKEIARVRSTANLGPTWSVSVLGELCNMALALLDVDALLPGTRTITERIATALESLDACQRDLVAIEELVPGDGDVVERVRRTVQKLEYETGWRRQSREELRHVWEQLRRSEAERDHAINLLGLTELPEERAEYAPGGYGAELNRVADVLNHRDCGGEGTVSDTVRELLDCHAEAHRSWMDEEDTLRASLAALAEAGKRYRKDYGEPTVHDAFNAAIANAERGLK